MRFFKRLIDKHIKRKKRPTAAAPRTPLAILLRGHTFLTADRFGKAMNASDNIDSLVETLIAPVRRLCPEARVYLATYDSPVLTDIQAKIGPCETFVFPAKGSSQTETFKQALMRIGDSFDALIATRFDLEFQKPWDQWGVTPDENKIVFPWREYDVLWEDHRRVGDAVHIIGRNKVQPFLKAIAMSQLAGKNDLHYAYYFLRAINDDMWLHEEGLDFIEADFWDSNTIGDGPMARNPLYRIFNRKQ